MIIDIDPKHRIRGTQHCWQLEVEHISDGKTAWRPIKYFATFGVALREAAQRELRTNPAHGLTEALEAVHRLTHKYSQIFDSVGAHP